MRRTSLGSKKLSFSVVIQSSGTRAVAPNLPAAATRKSGPQTPPGTG